MAEWAQSQEGADGAPPPTQGIVEAANVQGLMGRLTWRDESGWKGSGKEPENTSHCSNPPRRNGLETLRAHQALEVGYCSHCSAVSQP